VTPQGELLGQLGHFPRGDPRDLGQVVQVRLPHRQAQLPFPCGGRADLEDALPLQACQLHGPVQPLLETREGGGVSRALVRVRTAESQRAGPHLDSSTTLRVHTFLLLLLPEGVRAPHRRW
jgi:hypothetical protein